MNYSEENPRKKVKKFFFKYFKIFLFIQKYKNKFIIDEAVISGEDSEEDEDEDDYDLRDSFVDNKEHSCDGKCDFFFI